MSYESWVPPPPPPKRGIGKVVMRAVLGLFVAAVGSGFGYLGYRTISSKEFTINWKSARSSSISIPGIGARTSESSKGTSHWKGGEAVRLGVAFVALGAMFAVWGIAIGRPPRNPGNAYMIALTITSPACLTLFVILAIPPWPWNLDSAATGCYGAVLMFGLLLLALWRKLASPRILGRVFMLLMIGGIASTFLLPVSSHVPTGMVVGVFSSVFIIIHGILLSPRLRDIVRAEKPKADPQPGN